ncbi:MAG: radical SAM protein [Clostridium sp.]|uniref:SPL family radical SAM protein n=1 Tax=Clostridium sp. TaxID=1506 RepID=UPI001EBC5C4E|nr:radical SAM protein [Clostridium sp.]MBS5885122.1 radical SAM protein [Clostridium sp.]MDU7148617.1 radical SAM protein [Clostridium sp.]
MDYIVAKSIISGYRESNNWFGINYNMNIYKGCNHGCIYCDSRSECYGINNFESVRAKENSLEIIRRELKSKRKKGVVGTGAMSDPYNPFEKRLSLTRSALEIIDNTGFGVAIATKSDLIIRDIDILTRIKKHSPVLCKITITTAEDDLCRKIEPSVIVTSKRFDAVKKLSENGIYTGILLMPILPFINDTEENIINIIRLAKESGAKFIYPAFGVTLRSNQRDHFFDMIDKSFPAVKEKYIKTFGNEYMCNSPNARNLYKVFTKECERLGLLYKMSDIIYSYKNEYNNEQLSLFHT